MKITLNNLNLEKQRAEAELADLIRKSNHYFWEISNINKGIAIRKMGAGNPYVLEEWRDNQAMKILGVKEKLKSLQGDINTRKQNYKKTLVQNLAAMAMARQAGCTQTLLSEEQETSRALDTFLLNKIP